MEATRTGIGKLADLLPAQEHYWLLAGKKGYSRFGGNSADSGLLIFDTEAKATEFCREVAKGEWKPEEVSALECMILAKHMGGVCVVDGLTVKVGLFK